MRQPSELHNTSGNRCTGGGTFEDCGHRPGDIGNDGDDNDGDIGNDGDGDDGDNGDIGNDDMTMVV